MKILLAIIIVILCVIIAAVGYAADDYLYGFWVADNDLFCKRSGIGSMMLFIGKPSNGILSITRDCHIVITDNICNQGLKLTYNRPWSWNPYRLCVAAEVAADEQNIWPEHVNIDVNIKEGTLKIYTADTIYAFLCKQHDITNSAQNSETD